jgi:hypothetical protein
LVGGGFSTWKLSDSATPDGYTDFQLLKQIQLTLSKFLKLRDTVINRVIIVTISAVIKYFTAILDAADILCSYSWIIVRVITKLLSDH